MTCEAMPASSRNWRRYPGCCRGSCWKMAIGFMAVHVLFAHRQSRRRRVKKVSRMRKGRAQRGLRRCRLGRQAAEGAADQAAIARCSAAASLAAFRRSRMAAVRQHLRDLGQDLQVALRSPPPARTGTRTGPPAAWSGASKSIGTRRRSTAASGSFSFLIRPCGMATPWPSPVEPSRSRADQVVGDRRRAIAVLALEQHAGLLEQPALVRDVDIDQDVAHRQDRRQPVHGASVGLRSTRVLTAWPGRAGASSARLSASTLTRGSPRKPEQRPCGVRVDQRLRRARPAGRAARAIRPAW